MIIKVTSYVGSFHITKQTARVFRVANFEIQGDRIPASIGVDAGTLAVFDGANWVAVPPPTLDNQRLIADLSLAGKLRWATPGGEADLGNYLINGGFDFAQRQDPSTLTTIADNKYSADRWRITRANAELQYHRQDGLGESGLTGQYYGTWRKITNAGKAMVCQIIEGSTSVMLRSKTVTFQAKIKASAAMTVRMAIIELQNAGAIDTIPASLVSSWNASEVDPTLGTNLAAITGAQSKGVTTSWQQFSVTVQVPANSKNLICAIWSDDALAVNASISLAEAGLYVASDTQAWKTRLPQTELALCQRYYEKSYNVDIAPGTINSPPGLFYFNGSCRGDGTFGLTVGYNTVKRAPGTITAHRYSVATNVWDFARSGASGTSAVSPSAGQRGFYATVNVGGAWVVCETFGHWTCDAEL